MTAATLAERLEVSERTIYRDVADLIASGVPIRGEAGVGYRIDKAIDLPPLTLTIDEVEAVALGARIVERFGDNELRQAARALIDKVFAVLPATEQHRLDRTSLFALANALPEKDGVHLRALRHAAASTRKVHLVYRDEQGADSERTVLPLGMYFWGPSWTLAAYCELRRGFRNFRLDRVASLVVLDETFELKPPITLEDFIAEKQAETGIRPR